MNRNIVIGVVAFLLIAGVVWAGVSSYGKVNKVDNYGAVAVESTGGKLTVTETPIEPAKETITSKTTSEKKNMNKVKIETSMGDIVLELYPSDAPKAVENFLTLASKGFYDGVIFHRVIDGFMIQGGDPTGTGMGGPGYEFDDELSPTTQSYKTGYKKGVLAMANAGPNTNGSQFFIMLKDTPLPHLYTIFGHVVSGQEVVDVIGKVKTGAGDKPVTPVVMKKVTVTK